MQRNELGLGDPKYLSIPDFSHREAARDHHEVEAAGFGGIQLEDAEAAVTIEYFRVLLLDGFCFLLGYKNKQQENVTKSPTAKNWSLT